MRLRNATPWASEGHLPGKALGAVIGTLGALAPFALTAQPYVTLLQCVAAALALAALVTPVALPVLVVVEVNGADAHGFIRDSFLARRGGAVRLALLHSAVQGWARGLGWCVGTAAMLALASALAGSGVARDLGQVQGLVEPTIMLVLATMHGAVIGFGLSLALGDRSAGVAVHSLMLVLLAGLSAVQDLEPARVFATVLPLAPWWGTLGEQDIGGLALAMPLLATVINVSAWTLASLATITVSMSRFSGLPLVAWRRGV